MKELRAELAAIDRQILGLVARRQELAKSIGQVKDQGELSLRDFAQEKEVIERARASARELGISTEVGEEVMHLLIEYSLTAQEHQRVAAQGGGGGRRALVIGGSGRMGAWFTRFLTSQGFEVEVADPVAPVGDLHHLADWRESPLDHDLIVVEAGLKATQEILSEMVARRPRGVVFDIGSLKSPLRQPLRELAAAGVEVTSIHPMFGPDTELLSGRHVILVDLGSNEANHRVRELFGSTMAEVVEMDLEHHDRAVAYILGLSHALNIAFFTALAESGEAVPQLARLSSTTFDEQLAVSTKVAQESPRLYFEIQKLNDYGTESLSALLHAVERLRSVVRAGDEEGFEALMEKGMAYLAERRRD
ncbi:MAG: prephenate dehydrogenase/arogenate dehydrogenase family protein [Thermoanaerobaculia bacterium]